MRTSCACVPKCSKSHNQCLLGVWMGAIEVSTASRAARVGGCAQPTPQAPTGPGPVRWPRARVRCHSGARVHRRRWMDAEAPTHRVAAPGSPPGIPSTLLQWRFSSTYGHRRWGGTAAPTQAMTAPCCRRPQRRGCRTQHTITCTSFSATPFHVRGCVGRQTCMRRWRSGLPAPSTCWASISAPDAEPMPDVSPSAYRCPAEDALPKRLVHALGGGPAGPPGPQSSAQMARRPCAKRPERSGQPSAQRPDGSPTDPIPTPAGRPHGHGPHRPAAAAAPCAPDLVCASPCASTPQPAQS